MDLLVLFGVQGSGKGTQAKLLAEKFNYQIFTLSNVIVHI